MTYHMAIHSVAMAFYTMYLTYLNIDCRLFSSLSRKQNDRLHVNCHEGIAMRLDLPLVKYMVIAVRPTRIPIHHIETHWSTISDLHKYKKKNRNILFNLEIWPFVSPQKYPAMMTSSNGNIFRVTGPLCGEFTGPGEFPTQRPVTRSFDVFFHLRLNKRLSKQPWGWWFETL